MLLFVSTLAMTQVPFAQEASAVGMGWKLSSILNKRFVDVSASSDGMIAYATENPTGGLSRRIWKSTDGGANWSELANAPSTYWGAIAASGNGQIVFALSWDGIGQNIYQSIEKILPNINELEKELICIPVGWWITQSDLDYMIEKIKLGW